MKKILLCALALVITSFAVYDNAGTSGMTFLKIDFSPKASALGGACVGYSEGPNGLLSNPAAMNFSKDLSVSTGFGSLYAGITTGHLMAQKGFAFGKLGIALKYLSYGTMDKTDDYGNIIGDFSSTDMALALLFSREILDNLSFGIAPFVASSSIDTFSALAVAVDFGTQYKFDRGRGHLGLTVKNLGTQVSSYSEVKDTLATGVLLGASYRLKGLPLYALAQGDYYRDSGFSGGFGIELIQLKPLYIRAGYRIRPKVSGDLADGEDLNGITAGFGIIYKGIYADYSFQHFGVLGFTHRFGFAYDGFASK
ncbi:PorV/PorQ family protein [bacterium]|nr:PorV/PorQ family protein [bacterium]